MTIRQEPLGLTTAEVEERRSAGLVNVVESRTSRSVAGIFRANILTRFNAIMTGLLVAILVFGDLRDALFGVVMIVNAIIGIVQELRAKVTLDRLSVLVRPGVTVRREGDERKISTEEVVIDDLVEISVGDQVPVDADVLEAERLQVDESLLTGEADPLEKEPGDAVLSGSFVVAGSGMVRATAVGPDAYANKLAAEAKQFALAQSGLGESINRILRIVTWLLIPTSLLLIWSQLTTNHSFSEAMVATVAGVVAMVPQGLVLLVSMALAVAVIRLGRRNVLVQELPAVETLARVDTLCVDKTGTLTRGVITYEAKYPVAGGPPGVERALGAIAAADRHPNPTAAALAAGFPADPGWDLVDTLPFSSARKFSAFAFAGEGTWYLGAPDVLLPGRSPEKDGLPRDMAPRRVLLIAHTAAESVSDPAPSLLDPAAYLTFAEEVRPDAADTVRYFHEQNVDLKVISGDDAATVAAIASEVNVPNAERAVDARGLPTAAGLGHDVTESTVFGRVTPEQKRNLVDALQETGRTVAMTGDGVNDVLALKHADIGIAMGSGASATRAVAQLVLLDNRFSTLPSVVSEGRRVIANMERVASLFVTKTVYATLLALLVGFTGQTFPFLPRHLTLIGSLTIGIPAFFLSFQPTSEPVRSGFLDRVLRFALPSGIVAALVAFEVYGLTPPHIVGLGRAEASTAATITMVLLGLWILVELVRPLDRFGALLVGSMVGLLALTLALPGVREFFALVVPSLETWAVIAVAVLVGAVLVDLSLRVVDRVHRRMARPEEQEVPA